jgi:hypothetical protein
MSKLTKFRWSLSSIGVTVGTALITMTAIHYLYHRGAWRPESSLGSAIGILGGFGLLVSFVLAAVALSKNEPQFAGVIALILSMLSFLLYVQ